MRNVFEPKKFEIQFVETADGQFTGTLIVDGREMSVGAPKTSEEIATFLLPQRLPAPPPFVCFLGVINEPATSAA